MFHRNSKGTRRDAKEEEVERKEKKMIGRVPTSMGIAVELRASVNLGEGWFYGTVGMLYRYVAVLHRPFPLYHGHTPSSTLSSLPPSLTSSRSLPNPLSRHDTASLAVGGTTVTFYRCKPFVCSLARYSYNPRPLPLSYRTPTCVIDRAHTLTHARTRARLENGKRGCARVE